MASQLLRRSSVSSGGFNYRPLWRRRTADIYIGSRGMLVCGPDCETRTLAGTTFEQTFAFLLASLRDMPKEFDFRVWLSGGLCRPFLLDSTPGVTQEAELRTIAEALAPQETRLTGPCSVWMDGGLVKSPRVCAGIESATLESLSSMPVKGRIKSISPWWSEALRFSRSSRPGLQLLGVHDCDSLTLFGAANNEFIMIKTVTPLIEAEVAQAVMARTSLTAGLDEGACALARLRFDEDRVNADGSELALGRYAEVI